jgi:hypothetical protein
MWHHEGKRLKGRIATSFIRIDRRNDIGARGRRPDQGLPRHSAAEKDDYPVMRHD